tara:strand:+ start:14185 stop:15105 length:921 start_codon:yes stop_codon:yes gene_type:complete
MHKIYNFFISNLLVGLYFLNPKNKRNKNIELEIVIFSFNRPLQLESLLQSLNSNLDGDVKINILYKTDIKTNNSYEVLKKLFIKNRNINFIYQVESFKKSLFKLIKNLSDKKFSRKEILFFVDDQILFRKTKLNSIKKLFKIAPITTLRIGINTTRSFNLNKRQSIKDYNYSITKDLLTWQPLFKKDDISYVFSFDSSTIPLKLFSKFTRYLFYKGPNTLESAMNYGGFTFKILRLKISSFVKQCAINFVITKVQKETNNRGNFMEIKELQKLFKNNWKLKIDINEIDKFDSPHTDIGYLFEKKKI